MRDADSNVLLARGRAYQSTSIFGLLITTPDVIEAALDVLLRELAADD